MALNNDLLSTELHVTQSLPSGVKLSEDMLMFLKTSSSNSVTLSPVNSINVAYILQSVVEELKSVALSNSKLHDKHNHLNVIAKA